MKSNVLTNAAVRALKPPKSGMITVPDGAVGGLSILLGPRGKPSWTFVHRPIPNGKQVRTSLGFVWWESAPKPSSEYLTIPEARERALSIKNAAGDAVPRVVSTRATRTSSKKSIAPSFGHTVERYLADSNVQRLKTHVAVARMLRRETAPLSDRPITNIGRADIRALLEPKGATRAGNLLHSYLRTFFDWCVEQDIITASPVPNGRPMKHERERHYALTDSELASLWRCTEERPPLQRAIVQLLILTGQRRSEIACLKWSSVNLVEGTLEIRAADFKTGVPHLLPFTDHMRQIIEGIPRMNSSPFVFSITGTNAISINKERAAIERVWQSLGLPPAHLDPEDDTWILHDIRRTVSTGWARLRIPQQIVDCLTHPLGGVRGVYNRHAYMPEKREALEAWDRRVAKLIQGDIGK